MIIPDAATATWQDMCLAFAHHLEEAAMFYRQALDAGPEYIHNKGKPWMQRMEHLHASFKTATHEAEIWHKRARELR